METRHEAVQFVSPLGYEVSAGAGQVRSFLGTPVPYLEDAACIGRWSAFDFTVEDSNPAADARALNICRGCPELVPCGEWWSSLPVNRRPIGVCAGRVYRPKRKRVSA